MGRLQKKPLEPRSRIRKQSETVPMSKVKYISSSTEIPTGQNYVLVMYGEEYGEARHALGLTITVPQRTAVECQTRPYRSSIFSKVELPAVARSRSCSA